jgi:hypothetical protein
MTCTKKAQPAEAARQKGNWKLQGNSSLSPVTTQSGASLETGPGFHWVTTALSRLGTPTPRRPLWTVKLAGETPALPGRFIKRCRMSLLETVRSTRGRRSRKTVFAWWMRMD